MAHVTHIVGAGLAGLSAAVQLTKNGRQVVLHEAASQAGGRCRSYFDSSFGMVIDNGNHLLLSGNSSACSLLEEIGALHQMAGPAHAEFAFFDLANNENWQLQINDGLIPTWLFHKDRRVPHTNAKDYLGAAPLMWANAQKHVTDILETSGPLYKRLWEPLMIAALNTELENGSAKLAGAVMRNTLGKGGKACRPLIAKDGLSSAFIDPSLYYQERRGGKLHLNHRLRNIQINDVDRVTSLDFGKEDVVELDDQDDLILAVPAWIAKELMPEITAPTEHRSIINGHFRITPPAAMPHIIGVVNGMVEWIFSFDDRVSITISSADRLIDRPREELAQDIWRDVSIVTGLPSDLPPWQIVKEKRATFAATPEQDAKRPQAQTRWSNIYLAGDWTQTGLPATIEGAVRSGERAAALAMKGHKNGYRTH